jgi:3-hydroxy-3-methylglutaryl CoA synthase
VMALLANIWLTFKSLKRTNTQICFGSAVSDKENKFFNFRHLASNVGNMYTPSLYASLVSYLCEEPDLPGKKVALFSYGSGLASSFFSLQIKSGPGLEKIREALKDVKTRLQLRKKVSPGKCQFFQSRSNKNSA